MFPQRGGDRDDEHSWSRGRRKGGVRCLERAPAVAELPAGADGENTSEFGDCETLLEDIGGNSITDRTRESKGIPTAHTGIDATKFLSNGHAQVVVVLKRMRKREGGEERKVRRGRWGEEGEDRKVMRGRWWEARKESGSGAADGS